MEEYKNLWWLNMDISPEIHLCSCLKLFLHSYRRSFPPRSWPGMSSTDMIMYQCHMGPIRSWVGSGCTVQELWNCRDSWCFSQALLCSAECGWCRSPGQVCAWLCGPCMGVWMRVEQMMCPYRRVYLHINVPAFWFWALHFLRTMPRKFVLRSENAC